MDTQQILYENALLKAQLLSKDEQILSKDEQILSKDEQILLKEEQILLKEEQLLSLEEQLLRKQERILYLERQLFGRRSEKRLPDYCDAQLSLFDAEQGKKVLEMETPELISLVEDIKQKAEKRRKTKKELSVTQKRSYKIPADIERRETIIYPENVDNSDLIKIC